MAHSVFDRFDSCQLVKDRRILVGVSGGTDSLALMHLLLEAGYDIIVAHYNHHLRPDADDDALFVEETAKDLGCPFVGGEGDVASLAASEKLSIEAAARNARYQFLFDQAKTLDVQAVAVGHNADDQIETLLMHILRGSSLSGLAAMRPRTYLKQFSAVIPLVRPLLNLWRVDLEDYCREAGLSPRFDPTNQDTGYTRNRIRRQLIPILAEYNPQIKERLHSLTISARDSLEILKSAVDAAYQDALRSAGEGFRGFDRKVLTGMSNSLQIEVVRRAAMELLPQSEDLDQAAFQRAVWLLSTPKKDNHTDLADGLYAFTDTDRFYAALKGVIVRDSRFPQVYAEGAVFLNVPGRVALDHGWLIQSRWLETTEEVDPKSLKGDSSNVIIDADVIKLPLNIRRRAGGDRFRPLGMVQGSIKIGDFFTNLKLPRVSRDAWPLVFSEDTIIWVAGCQIADSVKIKPTSRRFVQLRLERIINHE